MLQILQVVSLCLVVLALTPALAHALEWPGKMRLDRDAYLAVQPIYYPGFTLVGGFGEVISILAVLVLLVMTPADDARFWWVATALISLAAMHAVYWVLTHPVNRYWLRNQAMGRAGTGFFAQDPLHREKPADAGEESWTIYRDRWERSHAVRAVLAAVGFVALAVGVAA